MTKSEQHRMILDLSYHSRSMNGNDRYEFEMIQKRDKDDEDLDSVAQRTLEKLAGRYLPKKSRKDVEELWRKLTSKGGPSDQS